MADFQPGHSLKLARSDTYHGTKAASNVVEFMQYSDADALSKALTDGSLDMAAPVSASTATGLNGKDGLTVKEGATTDKVLLAYNNGTDSLLSDEQARKAFRYRSRHRLRPTRRSRSIGRPHQPAGTRIRRFDRTVPA